MCRRRRTRNCPPGSLAGLVATAQIADPRDDGPEPGGAALPAALCGSISAAAEDACRCPNAGGAVGPEWFARIVPRPQPGGPAGRLADPRLRMHGGPRRGSRQARAPRREHVAPARAGEAARRAWRRPWPPNGQACGLRPRCADHDSKATTAPAPGLPGRSWPTTSTVRHPNRLTASLGSGPPARPPPEAPNGRAVHPRRGRSHSTPIIRGK